VAFTLYIDEVIGMSEKKSKDLPREKKKDKPVVRKVMGNVRALEDPAAKKPGPPTYEHG
jgi:hypothetical protein